MVNLSQVLEGTLAKKLADMLADPAMVYPDPVVTEMERCQLVFLEDRDNFFVTLSHCHVCLFVCLGDMGNWCDCTELCPVQARYISEKDLAVAISDLLKRKQHADLEKRAWALFPSLDDLWRSLGTETSQVRGQQ